MNLLETLRAGGRRATTKPARPISLRFELLEDRKLLSVVPATALPGQPLSYDVKTHVTTVLPGQAGAAAQPAASAGVIKPGYVFGTDERRPVSNSDLSNPSFAGVGRIWALYPDGAQQSFSGVLVGPRTALTAGHAVYQPAHGGWASALFFIPDQGGNKIFDPLSNNSSFRSDSEPYADALATNLETYQNWVTSQDADYDIGYITLDRNIGDFVGYRSIASFDDGLMKSQLFHLAGYPGDLDGATDTMYDGSGYLTRAVNANNVQTPTISLTAGEDGGPLYTLYQNNYYVLGVAEGGWDVNGQPSYNQFTRMTDSRFNDLTSLVAQSGRATDLPDVVDFDSWYNADRAIFAPGATNPGDPPGTIYPGQPFQARVFTANVGTGTSNGYTLTMYATSGTDLSGKVYPLGQVTYSSQLAPFQSSSVTLSENLPYLPTGTYHLGWRINTPEPQSYSGGSVVGVSTSITFSVPASAGPWQFVPSPPGPDASGQALMLLSDGSVMMQTGHDNVTNTWYRLTPDHDGNYLTGTWSPLASMNTSRLFFPTAMLPNGKVFAVGGEYSLPYDFTNTAEVFDSTVGSGGQWTSVSSVPTPPTLSPAIQSPTPTPKFGDDPIEVLPNGKVLAGYYNDPTTWLYDPVADSWSKTASKLHADRSDEETWVKLTDGSILSYDIFATSSGGRFSAQRYDPATNQWNDASYFDFRDPVYSLSGDAENYELGPAFVLPDQRAFFVGGNGRTAYYDHGTWTNGPNLPLDSHGYQMAAPDAPGAMLPNGHILLAMSPINGVDAKGKDTFLAKTYVYDFDPTSGNFTDVTPPNLANQNSPSLNMVVLPSGQVFMDNNAGVSMTYTPTGNVQDAWRPTISKVAPDVSGSFYYLTGTKLNGISEGASYGDDNESASNYPIVKLRDAAGNIYFARTSNWSTSGISSATDTTPETVQFTLPAGHVLSDFTTVDVVVNGIDDTGAFVIRPTVTGLSPTVGTTAGGTQVTISGFDLAHATAVKFGSTPATIISQSETSIVVTSPSAAAGTVDITVTAGNFTSATSISDQFTYVAPPAFNSMIPSIGPASGGTAVTLLGNALDNLRSVTFGGVPAAIVSDSPSMIKVTSPVFSAGGTVNVVVTTWGGASSALKFVYTTAPAVTRVSPNQGPMTAGVTVTIDGDNLGNATAVLFGKTPATILSKSPREIQVTCPAASKAGAVDVLVQVGKVTSAKNPPYDTFTYIAAPTVTKLAVASSKTASGPTTGGTLVTITGKNFLGTVTVLFDTIPGIMKSCTATQITVLSPAHSAGAAQVIVVTYGGSSRTPVPTKANTFTYVAPTAAASLAANARLDLALLADVAAANVKKLAMY